MGSCVTPHWCAAAMENSMYVHWHPNLPIYRINNSDRWIWYSHRYHMVCWSGSAVQGGRAARWIGPYATGNIWCIDRNRYLEVNNGRVFRSYLLCIIYNLWQGKCFILFFMLLRLIEINERIFNQFTVSYFKFRCYYVHIRISFCSIINPVLCV